MTGQQDDFSHLDRAGRATASLARSPRLTVNIAIAGGILLAWFILGAMAIRGAEGRLPGVPGDVVLRYLPQLPLPDVLDRFFGMCLTPAPLDAGGAPVLALIVMWFFDGRGDDAAVGGADDPYLL
ncbi:hypothetical protein NKH47_05050 [Mesorhizobium sp. M1060]|uniref:hypothetical protein n=1 Tax=unclassified Mesorhizobium TaxID=325217 RepID=UPI0004165B22|nr:MULTISPECIES: hypothetical protein [unclassified Mesorhizobium]WJI52537.1 hypothetical protein NLY44_07660 [Mesorhizobium sp. C089B]